MKEDVQTPWGLLRSGIYFGTSAWLIYAAMECCFLSIVPWFIHPGHAYEPVHAGFTVIVFAHYLAIGALVGALCGLIYPAAVRRVPLFSKGQAQTALPAVATSSVLVALAGALVLQAARSPEFWLVLAIEIFFAAALFAAVCSPAWSKRLSFLTSPWTVSIALLGFPWLAWDLLFNWSRPARVGAAFGYLVGVLVVSLIVQKTFAALRSGQQHAAAATPTFNVYVLGAFVVAVLAVSCLLEQKPLVTEPPSRRTTADSSAPNVVLMTLDTVRADHTSLHGYERDTTPKLRELAKVATRYDSAIASSDLTLSTHASIFTGLYTTQHAAYNDPPDYPFGRPLAKGFDTLAETLAQHGYTTMGVVANPGYLGHGFGLNQGFEHYDQRVPVLLLGRSQPYHLREVIRNVWSRLRPGLDSGVVYRRAEEINREVHGLIDKVHGEQQPFFVFVNYMDAHWPYVPPAPYDTLYPGKDPGLTTGYRNDLMKQVMSLQRQVTENERNHLVSQYDGGIAYIDNQVGLVIDRLKELGLYENCLIVITSDHGEAFGERQLVDHGVGVCQGQVHIPLLIKFPHQQVGNVVGGPVSVIDLMPTVLAVAGLEIPDSLLGTNLLNHDPSASRLVVSESYPSSYLLELHERFNRVERALYSGSLKLVSSTADKRELYDLTKDYDELHDLYNEHNVALRLNTTLNEWIDAVATGPVATGRLDPQTIKQLKSLGYWQ